MLSNSLQHQQKDLLDFAKSTLTFGHYDGNFYGYLSSIQNQESQDIHLDIQSLLLICENGLVSSDVLEKHLGSLREKIIYFKNNNKYTEAREMCMAMKAILDANPKCKDSQYLPYHFSYYLYLARITLLENGGENKLAVAFQHYTQGFEETSRKIFLLPESDEKTNIIVQFVMAIFIFKDELKATASNLSKNIESLDATLISHLEKYIPYTTPILAHASHLRQNAVTKKKWSEGISPCNVILFFSSRDVGQNHDLAIVVAQLTCIYMHYLNNSNLDSLYKDILVDLEKIIHQTTFEQHQLLIECRHLIANCQELTKHRINVSQCMQKIVEQLAKLNKAGIGVASTPNPSVGTEIAEEKRARSEEEILAAKKAEMHFALTHRTIPGIVFANDYTAQESKEILIQELEETSLSSSSPQYTEVIKLIIAAEQSLLQNNASGNDAALAHLENAYKIEKNVSRLLFLRALVLCRKMEDVTEPSDLLLYLEKITSNLRQLKNTPYDAYAELLSVYITTLSNDHPSTYTQCKSIILRAVTNGSSHHRLLEHALADLLIVTDERSSIPAPQLKKPETRYLAAQRSMHRGNYFQVTQLLKDLVKNPSRLVREKIKNKRYAEVAPYLLALLNASQVAPLPPKFSLVTQAKKAFYLGDLQNADTLLNQASWYDTYSPEIYISRATIFLLQFLTHAPHETLTNTVGMEYLDIATWMLEVDIHFQPEVKPPLLAKIDWLKSIFYLLMDKPQESRDCHERVIAFFALLLNSPAAKTKDNTIMSKNFAAFFSIEIINSLESKDLHELIQRCESTYNTYIEKWAAVQSIQRKPIIKREIPAFVRNKPELSPAETKSECKTEPVEDVPLSLPERIALPEPKTAEVSPDTANTATPLTNKRNPETQKQNKRTQKKAHRAAVHTARNEKRAARQERTKQRKNRAAEETTSTAGILNKMQENKPVSTSTESDNLPLSPLSQVIAQFDTAANNPYHTLNIQNFNEAYQLISPSDLNEINSKLNTYVAAKKSIFKNFCFTGLIKILFPALLPHYRYFKIEWDNYDLRAHQLIQKLSSLTSLLQVYAHLIAYAVWKEIDLDPEKSGRHGCRAITLIASIPLMKTEFAAFQGSSTALRELVNEVIETWNDAKVEPAPTTMPTF